MIIYGDNLPPINAESSKPNQLSAAARPDPQPRDSQTRGGRRLSIDIEHVPIKSVIRALTSYGLCVTTIGGRLTVREAK